MSNANRGDVSPLHGIALDSDQMGASEASGLGPGSPPRLAMGPSHVAAASQPTWQPRPFDVALAALAGVLWFAPSWFSALGFPLLALLWWRRRRALGAAARTGLDGPVLVLLVLGVGALAPSVNLEISLPRLLGLWLGVALFLVVFDLLTSEKRLWLVVSGLAVLGLVLAVVGLVGTDWTLAGGLPIQVVYEHLPKLIAFLPSSAEGGLHPNKLAAALGMLLPLPAAVMLFTPGRLLRLGWGLAMGVVAITLVLTQSLSGILAAGAALLALGAARSHRVRIMVAPLVALVVMMVVWWLGPRALADALLALALVPGEGSSLDNRLGVWSLAIAMIQTSPLFGIGIGTFAEAVDRYGPLVVSGTQAAVPHAHNLYLQFALDLGLPGLLAFLALLAAAFRQAQYAVRRGPTARARGLAAGVACGLLAYLVYGLTDAIGPGEKPGLFFWLLLGTIAAGARLAERVPGANGSEYASNGSAKALPIGSVIYVSTFEWNYHTARPQQLARALAERVPVLYVETTGLRGVGPGDLRRLLRRVRRGLAGRHRVQHGLWVFSPLVLPVHRSRLARTLNRMLLRDAVRGQARDLGLERPLLLISIPTAAAIDLVGHLGEVASIYDCMDDLTAVPTVDRSTAATEAELARCVDVVVAASEELRRVKAGLRADIAVVGQGVEVAHFARPMPCPPELGRLPRPRLLCVAGIDERIDFGLLNEVARLRPHWSIVLVGPQLYLLAAELIREPNVQILGHRPFLELPAYMQAADVCIIPYRDTPWARACNPVKTLEYLAAGRPVVSTDLPAVRAYQPLVRIAEGVPEFVAAVEAALADDAPAAQSARRALAVGAPWRDRADAIYRLGAVAAGRERERVSLVVS